MKLNLNRIITVCAMVATLALSATSLLAQDNANGGNGGGQGGGGGRRNFDPAQMQQRIVDGLQDRLGFTNDTDWAAVQPLVAKVVAAQFEARASQMRGMMGGRNRGGGQGGNGGRGGFGGPPNPDAEALQKALDDDAPTAQVKDLLARYQASQKAKQAKLEAAQSDLRSVLTTKQEAQATLLGLL